MSDDPLRDSLKTRVELDAEPPVVCGRCGQIHRGVSREDYDAMIRQKAHDLAQAIDDKIARQVYGDYHR